MLSTENSGAVLTGRPLASEGPMKMSAVKVMRGFVYQGRDVQPGEVLDLPAHFALDLMATGKAELVATPLPVPAEESAGVAAPIGDTTTKGGTGHAR